MLSSALPEDIKGGIFSSGRFYVFSTSARSPLPLALIGSSGVAQVRAPGLRWSGTSASVPEETIIASSANIGSGGASDAERPAS